MEAVLSLGTNLGEREEILRRALRALDALPETHVSAVSDVYETEPVGYADQPDFLNIVAVLLTGLSPRALLGACLGVEAALGRVRTFPNAPRVIDIDFLLAEGVVMAERELTLPHPRMGGRAFVLVPLRDLYPDLHPLGFDFSGEMREDGVRFYCPGDAVWTHREN